MARHDRQGIGGLADELRYNAEISARPGQYDGLYDIAEKVESLGLLALDELQADVAAHCARWRPSADEPANPLADALAVAEEAGEVCRAALKRYHGKRPGTDWGAAVRSEAADVAITLLSLAANEGWSLAEAIAERWAEVSKR